MAAEAGPTLIVASERFTFRLSSSELAQLRAYAACEGITPSEAIRSACYEHGVLTDEAVRTRPGPIQGPQRPAADVLARRHVRRYLKAHGFRVVTVLRSLPGLDLLALDAHQVRAIHVANAMLETTSLALDLPPAVTLERWTINGADEPHIELLRRESEHG